MGLLRLLTNPRVMGADLVGMSRAWEVYDALASDRRTCFFAEPAGLEPVWRESTTGPQASTNVWIDSYLLAFAKLRDVTVVTFDRAFAATGDPQPLLLI